MIIGGKEIGKLIYANVDQKLMSILDGKVWSTTFILADYMFFGREEIMNEMLEWLEDNMTDEYMIKGSAISFMSNADAIQFKLVWG